MPHAPQTPHETRGFPTLLRDDRAVTMLLGLAMASFLVGVVWFLIGVGDAVTIHEQAQDAADAAAFSAAVFDAKGMNTLVLLNLLIQFLIAVIVALNLIYTMVEWTVVLALWNNASAHPGADVGWDQAEPLAGLLATLVKSGPVVDGVAKAVKGVDAVANAVAVGMPWVAETRSVEEGNYYKPAAQSAMTLAVSQDPALVFEPVLEHAGSIVVPKGALGKRLGLPVHDGPAGTSIFCYPKLPEIASNVMTRVIAYGNGHGVFSLDGNQTAGFVLAASQFTESLDSQCSAGQGVGTLTDASYLAVAQTVCAATENMWNLCVSKAVQVQPGVYSIPGSNFLCVGLPGWSLDLAPSAQGAFDNAWCVNYFEPTLKEAILLQVQSLNDWLKSLGAGPKAIYPYAVNGDDYMAVWGIASGNDVNDTQAGVSVAAWKKGGPPAADPVTMVAKAEFFYDAQTAASSAADVQWKDVAQNAMWAPRWRARMRRVAPPMIPGAGLGDFESFVAGTIAPYVASTSGGGGAGTTLSKFFQLFKGSAGGRQGEAERAAGFLH